MASLFAAALMIGTVPLPALEDANSAPLDLGFTVSEQEAAESDESSDAYLADPTRR